MSVEMKLDDIGLNIGVDPIETSFFGAKNKPIAMMVLGDKEQPVAIEADLDVNADVGMNASVTGAKDAPVTMMMLGDDSQPISGHITGDKEKPMAMAMEMTNLPRFTVENIKELTTPKVRLSFPGHQQFCFKVLGRELFSMCMGGEQQVIAQEYVPTAGEDCTIPACDVDTRPFPKPIKG